MSDVNYDICRRLQWEYTAIMDDAYRDRDMNGGTYSKEGVAMLTKAAIAQRELAAYTTGATRSTHQAECNRLTRLVRQESERLGIIQVPQPPKPVAQTKPVVQVKPTSMAGAAAPAKPARDFSSEEVGESFSLEQFVLEPGDITLDDVQLSPELAEQLKDAIDPMDSIALFPKATQGWKPRPRSNFLFFGPPGTGKSHLCNAINGSIHKNYPGDRSIFYLIDGNKLVSKWRGSTGHRLDVIFQEAEKREFTVICIDEFEQLCPDRTKLEERESYTKNFLTLMEGVGGRTKAMVIACTNHPQLLDPAILSRMQNRVFIDYPTEEDIYRYFMSEKQNRDYLGENDEEAGKVARELAKSAAGRRLSYRNLNAVVTKLGDAVAHKTRALYPNGNPDLEHMCALDAAEALGTMDSVDSDYDAEQYGLYQDYLTKKGKG